MMSEYELSRLGVGKMQNEIYFAAANASEKIDSMYDTLLERSRCTDAWEARAREYEGRYSTLMKRFDTLQKENADLIKTNAELVRTNTDLVRLLSKNPSKEDSAQQNQQNGHR